MSLSTMCINCSFVHLFAITLSYAAVFKLKSQLLKPTDFFYGPKHCGPNDDCRGFVFVHNTYYLFFVLVVMADMKISDENVDKADESGGNYTMPLLANFTVLCI